MHFLLFQVYAPLISWGKIAVGEERHSSDHPSKSAIIGLISAAIGIDRDDEEQFKKLTDSFSMGVQLYSSGTVLRDFHTIRSPMEEKNVVYNTRRAEMSSKKIQTLLSRREYRCDAFSVVAIQLKNPDPKYTLTKIQKALKTPKYQLYFGRKSCVPALPLDPTLIKASNLKEAFKAHHVKAFEEPLLPIKEKGTTDWLIKEFKGFPQKVLCNPSITYYWEDGIKSGMKEMLSVDQYDQPISRKRWQFTSRWEYMAIIKEGGDYVYY